MDNTILSYITQCAWYPAHYLVFSENVFGNLVYYSHLLPLVVSLILALFILFKNPKLPPARWLFVISVLLSVWLFSDLVLWATDMPQFTMFFWSLLVLIEPMIYAAMLFFLYSFVDGKESTFKVKAISFALLLPTVILSPTKFALTHFDLTNCNREAIEGPLAFYGYGIEVIFALWILIFGMERFGRFVDQSEKKKVALVTVGAVFFLLSFAMGNVVGSLLVNWEIGQYGLFGIPIFMAMLSYLIVKYKAFDIKLISTQLLVTVLWIMTLAIIFLRRIGTVRIVVAVTLFLFTILGYLLIRSVKREVALREQLQVANEGQADLLHIINHQIKGYMTKARLVLDALLTDPSYGPVPEPAKPLVKQGFDSVTEGVNFVQDFLNASNIEKGTYTYSMAVVNLREIVEAVAVEQKQNAEQKGLSFELFIADGDYNMAGDKAQLNQAVRNLFDNSIKYTPSGSINAQLSMNNKKALLKVSDTGVGLDDEIKQKLWTKGGRGKDSLKININSTGFGLAFVKGVAEAHKGRVWAESAGPGEGSQFYMELPLSN